MKQHINISHATQIIPHQTLCCFCRNYWLFVFPSTGIKKELKNCFIHHVYFWLKNPDSKADLEQLFAGLKKLSNVKTIQQFHIGKPAATRRDVIESSYTVSWFTQFANAADERHYQTDPIHLKFIEECSHLWSKVVVYDSIDA